MMPSTQNSNVFKMLISRFQLFSNRLISLESPLKPLKSANLHFSNRIPERRIYVPI